MVSETPNSHFVFGYRKLKVYVLCSSYTSHCVCPHSCGKVPTLQTQEHQHCGYGYATYINHWVCDRGFVVYHKATITNPVINVSSITISTVLVLLRL